MRIVQINQLKFGMTLEQNIFRHDGLLCLPKGVMLKNLELEMLNFYQIQFVQVSEPKVREIKTEETLEIIKGCYEHSTLWKKEFGEALYNTIEKEILKNKKVQRYLNELREIDSYSFAQCINISLVMAKVLAEKAFPDKGLGKLAYLSLIHDVGRIKFKSLFNKEGKLTEKEFTELQKHPQYSYELLRQAGFSDYDILFVLQTHENVDGTGYPNKLREKEIQPMAQLILLSDMYNALCSYRPHRKAYVPIEAMAMMLEEKGKMFSAEYLELFLNRFSPYQEGSLVELSNGCTGIIKKINERNKLFPVVDIISELTGDVETTVDLNRYNELRIVKIIQSY